MTFGLPYAREFPSRAFVSGDVFVDGKLGFTMSRNWLGEDLNLVS